MGFHREIEVFSLHNKIKYVFNHLIGFKFQKNHIYTRMKISKLTDKVEERTCVFFTQFLWKSRRLFKHIK